MLKVGLALVAEQLVEASFTVQKNKPNRKSSMT
jgi:hypothetical protein